MSFLKDLFGRKTVGGQGIAVPQQARQARGDSPEQREQKIGGVLAQLETRLRAERNSSLPVVTLSLRDTPLGRHIVWCYRKTYQTPATLNVAEAESLLNEELKAINIAVTESDYMGGQGGEANQLFAYRTRPSDDGSAHEEQVRSFDKLDRKQAVPKAAELLAQGQVELLVAWLRYGKYHGIPAEVLQKANRPDAAQAILALLKNPSPEVRMRAADALGPIGGVDAARDLCGALPGAENMQEYFGLAGALGRLAWPGAVEPLFAAIEGSQDGDVRAALAEALVRCGDVERGLNKLYAGLSNDQGSEAYAGALSDLDKDGIRDSRLVPEFTALLERTHNNNATETAQGLILHRHKDEWLETRRRKYPPVVRHAPTKKVKPFNGETMYSIEEASAITGIPVDEIHRLIRDRRVFAPGSSSVALNGSFPCGELIDHPNPRWCAIGAKQDISGDSKSSSPPTVSAQLAASNSPSVFDLASAADLLGPANVVTPEQNIAAFNQPLSKDEHVLCPSVEQVQECAAQNKAGTHKWVLAYASALSFRDQHRILGTDCNHPPNFRPNSDYMGGEGGEWFLKPKENQWMDAKPEAGYYLLDMTPRWNLTNWQKQGDNIAALGPDYERADERVFAQAVLAYQKATGQLLFDDVFHWGRTLIAPVTTYVAQGPGSGGFRLRVGLFDKGLSLDTSLPAWGDIKVSFVCVARKSTHHALIA